MKKKVLTVTLAASMAVFLAACGGSSSGENAPAGGASENKDGSGVSITIFNSKSEVQGQFEEMAAEYSEKTGVDVEVYYSSDTVAAHLATRYSANDPYTLAMVDAKDIYSLAKDYASDLSSEEWIKNTNYAISVDNKVVGFPVCVEARGIIYNAEAIETITGKPFEPANYATLDAFKGLLDEL